MATTKTLKKFHITGKSLQSVVDGQILRDIHFKSARVNMIKMRDQYRILKELGKGAYGEVMQCVYIENIKNKKCTVKDYRACKILSKSYMDQKAHEEFKNEIECMWVLQHPIQHPNIINMFHYFEDPKRYCLIEEICTGGDLFDFIQAKFESREHKLQDGEIAIILKQLLSAVRHSHKKKIVHRDLKPENMMLDRPGDIHNIKLIDFGTGLLWDQHIEEIHHTEGELKGTKTNAMKIYDRKGTLNYMAPEVISAQEDLVEGLDVYINELSDMWSIGIIAYVMLTGEHPFPEGKALPDEKQQADEIKRQIKTYDLDDVVCPKCEERTLMQKKQKEIPPNGTAPQRIECTQCENRVDEDFYYKCPTCYEHNHRHCCTLEFHGHHKIFEKQSFRNIKNSQAQDFIQQLLDPRYKKEYDKKEFTDVVEEPIEEFKIYQQRAEDPKDRIRMSALQALNHPFITNVSDRLIEQLNDSTTTEGKLLNRIAKGSLEYLKVYKPYMSDKDGEPIEGKDDIKQAILQVFIAYLITDEEKYAMKTLFKIMDKSGDGLIQEEELKFGYEVIMKEENDKDFYTNIIKNCKTKKDEESLQFDQSEFMTAALDMKLESFIDHMKVAYKLFFKNDDESIALPEFIDTLCHDKSIKQAQLTALASAIDEDGSQKISVCEFFTFMIESLEIKAEHGGENITATYVKEKLQHEYPNIGMSGVFITETFKYEAEVDNRGLFGKIGGGIGQIGGGIMNAGGAVKNLII